MAESSIPEGEVLETRCGTSADMATLSLDQNLELA